MLAQYMPSAGCNFSCTGCVALVVASLCLTVAPRLIAGGPSGIYRSQGEMAGEVTETSVILQSRLTGSATVVDGDVPGSAGVGRFEISTFSDFRQSRTTAWLTAQSANDFILKAGVSGLRPATRYHYRLQFGVNEQSAEAGPTCTFKTLQGSAGGEPVSFVVVTGMNYVSFHHGLRKDGQRTGERAYTGADKALGFPALATILKMKPDFFVGTGDNVYYDSGGAFDAHTIHAMRKKWHQQLSQPRFVDLFREVPTYWEKDDHDHRYNDCDRAGDRPPSSELGIRIFREQVPIVDPLRPDSRTYRTHRVNKHLQIWLVEGRDYRSPNKMQDGPDKTLWGREQIDWLKRTLLASDATFKLLISPTPMIGPDDAYKIDNHTNHRGFRHEGRAFFQWVKAEGLDKRGFYLLCGDRHWQYHSVDPTGLEEFSCGALVDANSRIGRSPGDPESTDPDADIKQEYTQSTPSGGFLRVVITAEAEARFEFFDEKGELQYAEVKQGTHETNVLGDGAASLLFDHLLDRVHAQYDRRRESVEKSLRSPEAIRKRQGQLQASLRRIVGELPSKSPLNALVTGVIEEEAYRIEKIVYQSRPHHYVTANLYVPTKGKGPFPGVLIACGHSSLGKAYSAYQLAAILMARHGFLTMIYDPCGQGERLSYLTGSSNSGLQHKLDNLGSVLVGRTTVGYQAWDGIRSMDYLLSRPEIDRSQPIGMTGNSGGGAQTMYLMALDDRIGPAAPSCHITTLERNFELGGAGDGCQSAPFTGAEGIDHADFFAMRAPRPSIILSAEQDYKDIRFTRKTFAEVARVYRMLGHPHMVDMFAFDDKHSFSKPRREAAVGWMKLHLQSASGTVVEPDEVKLQSADDLQVTQSGQVLREFPHARAVSDLNLQRAQDLALERERLWNTQDRPDALEKIRALIGLPPERAPADVERRGVLNRQGYRVEKLTLRRVGQVPVPALLFLPHPLQGRHATTIYVDGRGKAADAMPGGAIEALVKQGRIVMSIDVRGFGETAEKAREIVYSSGDHRAAMLSMHLGQTLLGQRVEDLLGSLDFLITHTAVASADLQLVGVGNAGPVALHAAVLDSRVRHLTLKGSIQSWVDDVLARPGDQQAMGHVVPSALKHYDLTDLIALLGSQVTIAPDGQQSKG